jgi:hypothetical protein
VFDLRYHVASLAAVFLALIIGILVGAGLAARTDVEGSERRVLQDRIRELEQRNDDLTAQGEQVRQEQQAMDEYIDATYAPLMNGRLRGTRVAMLFTGPADQGSIDAVERTLEDASGQEVVQREALDLPIDPQRVLNALEPEFSGLSMDEVGRRLGTELAEGGETPFWDALLDVIVQDHRGDPSAETDAVVVAHTGVARDAPTRELLDGIYAGLAASGEPVVGIENGDQRPTRVPVYKTKGISSVDTVDSQLGRLALALLLAGAPGGHYGLKETAEDGPLPTPVESLPLAPLSGG